MQVQKNLTLYIILFYVPNIIQNNTGRITVDTLGAGTASPTISPKPTQAPTPCQLGKVGDFCNDYGSGGNSGCCSGLCQPNGKPSNRKCLSNTPTTPAPTPSVTENSPEPTRGCTLLPRNGLCVNDDAACCSQNCKRNGKCA